MYVKEAFARVTVELAKHMWPQRWGSFINNMDTLAKCGVSFYHVGALYHTSLVEENIQNVVYSLVYVQCKV